MESEREIAGPGFAVQHPELHHYTNLNGLRGIVESNSIWATHFSHLNDATEIMLLKQPLIKILTQRALKAAWSPNKSNQNVETTIDLDNKEEIAHETTNFIGGLFTVAFEGFTIKSDGKFIEPLSDPYLTSFCTHRQAQIYERVNGLLSQWRAYGGGERYCIVFDTQKLINILDDEFDKHYWTYLRLSEVNYAVSRVRIDRLFPDLLNSVEFELVRALRGGGIDISMKTIVNLLSAATRFKHQGFKEEKEVRIIAIPGKQSTVDMMQAAHPDQVMALLKQIRTGVTTSGERPYIALFDRIGATLPIKRVIVGPSRNRGEGLARARHVLGADFPLSQSETPFIG